MKKKSFIRIIVILTFCCIFTYFVCSLQPKDGWRVKNGNTQYIVDKNPVTGWQEIDGSLFYFSESGYLCTGWQEIDGHLYYLSEDGILATGWQEINSKTYYLGADGIRRTGWHEIGGNRYFFEEDGHMATGIVLENGAAYLLNEEGKLSTGWQNIYGKTYYADENAHPLFGWVTIDGRKHYFDETGAAASGWIKLDGFMYYFYTDGAPAQGKVLIDGVIHHFASNGQVLYLVNPWNVLPKNYAVELVPINDLHQIADVAYRDYLDMVTDCEAAGFMPVVCSSYRTQEYQEGLYRNRIDRYVKEGYSVEEATELAGRSVAVPGTSEHQLGLALDLVDNENWHLDETQADMPTQIWLMENSWRYGWILRYPNEKSEITGIIYEPWHYRYVGKTIAKEIYDLGICLEEYLEMLTTSVG